MQSVTLHGCRLNASKVGEVDAVSIRPGGVLGVMHEVPPLFELAHAKAVGRDWQWQVTSLRWAGLEPDHH